MDRRKFFITLGVALATPKVLLEILKQVKPINLSPFLDQLNKGIIKYGVNKPIFFTQGIIPFIKNNPHNLYPTGEAAFWEPIQKEINGAVNKDLMRQSEERRRMFGRKK